jgi:hypothetical protein
MYECRDLQGMRVCLPMYGGNTWRDTAANLKKAGVTAAFADAEMTKLLDHPNVLGVFKSTQRALNDYGKKKMGGGLKPVLVDGRIGPQTYSSLAGVLAHMGQAGPQSVDDAALWIWCQRPDKAIAAAAGTSVDTSVGKKPGERPERSTTAGVTDSASGKIPPPGGEPGKYRWAWWVIGGAALVGVVAVGVSLARGEGEEAEVFPAT